MNRFETAIKLALEPRQVEEWRATNGFENAESWEVTRQQGDIDFAVCGRFSRQYVADPIFTPIFTLLLGSGGFTLFGTTITYASVASAIATTAVVAGLQYALQPKPPTPEDGRVPLTQPVPYRFWGVGKCRMAGAFMLWEAKNNHLLSVQAIVGHRINGFTKFYLHDDEVTLQETGEVNAVGSRYSRNVYIWSRLGLVPETAYEEIVARLGAENIWTEDHRLDGTASLGMLCAAAGRSNESTCFPNGKPILSAEAELALVWDMRDSDQDPRDPSTWVYSENPVLQLCWHECFNKFGNQRDYRKAILPVLDMWQEEADVCDEQIPRASGGFENRYTCGGNDTTENGPKSGTNAILASMDGWMCERGDGALLVVAGKFREKYVATITDADIIGHKLENDVLFDEEVNRLVPKFTYPATLYTTTDTDFFEDTPAQILAGRILPLVANFPWVTQWRQARRLGKREFARVRERKRGSLDMTFTAINAAYAPWARLQTPKRLPTLNGKVVSNRSSKFAPMQGGFQMTFVKMPGTGPEIDDWTPATDEGEAPPVPAKPVTDGIPDPVIDTAIAVGTGTNVYLRIVLIDPQRSDVYPRIRYRLKDRGDGQPGEWVLQDFDNNPIAGLITCNTSPVPNDQLLQVQAAFAVVGAYGNYRPVEPLEIQATVDGTSPGDLTAVSTSGNLLGGVTFNATTPATANVRKLAIYRTPTGVTLNRTTHHVETINVLPNTAYSRNQGDVTRTNLLLTPDFASDTNWTKGTGWSIGSGVASKSAGVISNLYQTLSLSAAAVYRFAYTRASSTAGNIVARLSANNRASAGNDFANAAWTKTNITVTAGAITAGGRTFAKVEATSSAVTTLRQQIAGVGQAGGQTFEIYIKKGSGATDANKFILRNQTTATNIVNISINYDTGVITGATSSNAQAEDVGNGVWRLTLRTSTGISNGDELWLYACFIGASETAAEYAYVGDASLFDGVSAQPTAVGTFETTNASHYGALTADAVHTQFQIRAAATTSDGSIDNAVLYERTGSCLPQGTYDIYAEALNGSGVPGGLSGPHTVTII